MPRLPRIQFGSYLIKVEFFATLRDAAGKSSHEMPFEAPAPLSRVYKKLVEECRPGLEKYLFTNGSMSKELMVVINEEVVPRGQDIEVRDEDTVTLLMPLSGG